MNPTDRLLQKMPFMRGLFADNDVQKINDRFAIFDGASISKEKKVQRLSTVNRYDYNLQNPSGGGYMAVSYYNQLMYSASSDNKKKRIDDYRSMANYPEVERALGEICKEFFVEDDRGKLLKFKLEGEHNSEVQLLLEDEFYSFIEELKLKDRGKKYIWDWLVEGELFFENIVSMQKPELGIIGFRRISSDRCDPLYYDLDNELIDTFILRNKSFDMYPFQIGYQHAQTNSHGPNHTNQILFLNEKQVTYIANDRWADGKKYRLPMLSYANRPYRQLSLIEDCTIIYMLARAPERLVFNIDVGNMNPSAADQHIRKLMSQFWAKKTLTNDGRIENMYDPQGITENFVFPKYNGGNGSSVESLAGGKSTPDNLEVLNIFVQKLYQSLRVPLGRLNSDTQYSDGEAISREELAFAEYIIDIQKMWAAAIKNAFIVHLKLKGKRLLESAKKLDIRDIVQNSETGSETSRVNISDIYREGHFTTQSWDNYWLLDEQIQKKIDAIIENNNKKYDALVEEYSSNQKEIELIKNGLLLEDGTNSIQFIQDNIIRIEEDLDALEEQNQQLQDIKNDSRSWWEEYDLREEDVVLKFTEPSQFFQLKRQQMLTLKMENFNGMSSNDLISNTFCQKVYLGWNDREILANREFLIRDAGLRWELGQIEQNGPDFREKALEELQSATGEGGGLPMGAGGAGGGLPPMGGGDTSLPDFGQPDAGGGESSEEGTSLPSGDDSGGGNTPPPPKPPGNNE